jgi:hypothetical protein
MESGAADVQAAQLGFAPLDRYPVFARVAPLAIRQSSHPSLPGSVQYGGLTPLKAGEVITSPVESTHRTCNTLPTPSTGSTQSCVRSEMLAHRPTTVTTSGNWFRWKCGVFA